MSQLGITRVQLKNWADECGLALVPKPEKPFECVSAARVDDRKRFDGVRSVYFAQESGTGAIKIGVSKQLSKRMGEISRYLPYEFKLLVAIEGGREVEWTAHNRFEHARLRGEWFRPVPELLEYIAKIKEESTQQTLSSEVGKNDDNPTT